MHYVRPPVRGRLYIRHRNKGADLYVNVFEIRLEMFTIKIVLLINKKTILLI